MNEYVGQPMSTWFIWAFAIGMLMSCLLWLAFAHFTMRPIEKRMKKEGLPDSFTWDGTGGRIIFYACALALPERFADRINPRLIDAPLIRSYASRADRLRGIVFLSAFSIWILIGFIGVLLGFA